MESLQQYYGKLSTQELEGILRAHMTGEQKCPGEVVLTVCEILAKRINPAADATKIYRHYLETFLPGEIKNDL